MAPDVRRLDQSPATGRRPVCLLTENQILREKLDKKRILLDDCQRRRLATQGKILGRKVLDEPATIVTPETILRRHRNLVAAHWDYSKCRKSCGRPPVGQEMVGLVSFPKIRSRLRV
jgi:hypothetical protein